MLHRLIYISSGRNDISYKQIKPIAEKAALNNKAMGISGVLLYNHKYFAQIIEGERDNVNSLFQKIFVNKIHKNIQVIESNSIKYREFDYYGLKLLTSNKLSQDLYFKYSSDRNFNPYKIEGDALVGLLFELSYAKSSRESLEEEKKIIDLYEAS